MPIIRIEDAFKAPRWIDSLENRNDGLDWTYGGARSLAPRHEHAAHRIREAGRHVRDIGWSGYRAGPPAHRTRWHDYEAGWRSRAHEALEGTDSRGKRRVKLARVKPRYATMHLSHSHATRWLKQARPALDLVGRLREPARPPLHLARIRTHRDRAADGPAQEAQRLLRHRHRRHRDRARARPLQPRQRPQARHRAQQVHRPLHQEDRRTGRGAG
ncbi:hypothetical protein ACFSTC_57575 [Nonomuraea ferruginea]